MEVKLKEDEERLRNLIEHSLVGIYVVNEEKKVVFANKVLVNMINEDVEDVLGKDMSQYVHPDDINLVREIVEKQFKGEETPERYEIKFMRENGLFGWAEIHSSLINYDGKPSIFGNVIDITNRKNMEAQLRHSQKM